MSFYSIDYLVFFPIVVNLYFVFPRKIRMYWLLLVHLLPGIHQAKAGGKEGLDGLAL